MISASTALISSMLTPIALVVLTVAAPVLHSTDARPAAAAQLGRKVRVAN